MAFSVFLRSSLLACTLLASTPLTASPSFALSHPPLHLVQDTEAFTAFARQVAHQADGLLAATPPPDPATRKLLLGLLVHVALHDRADDRALALADQIRAGQTDPGERAHSGLTTRAVVASQRDPVRFEREFTRLLTALPRDPQTRAALTRARDRVEQLSEAALLEEVRSRIAPRLARGEPCTLEIADQIIRVGHRMRTTLPLREAMLRAYSAALATRE